MAAGPNEQPSLQETLGGLDTDSLEGQVGDDLRTARDFAQNHPIPSDSKVIEGFELTGGGAQDEVEHNLGREPVGMVVVWTSVRLDTVPATTHGDTLSPPKPNDTHSAIRSTTAATVNLLVF